MHARLDPGAVDSSDLGVVSRPSPPRPAKRPSRVWRKRSPSREDVCCGGCAAAAYVDVATIPRVFMHNPLLYLYKCYLHTVYGV